MRPRMSQMLVNMRSRVNLCILLNIIIKIRKRLFVIIKAQFDGSETYTYYKIDSCRKG